MINRKAIAVFAVVLSFNTTSVTATNYEITEERAKLTSGVIAEINEALTINSNDELQILAGVCDAIQIYIPEVEARNANIVQSAGTTETDAEETDEKEKEQQEYNLWLLAKAIHGEAGICDLDEKYKVATVIMNRVDDPRFKNTIEGVLAEGYESYHNEFWYSEEPSDEDWTVAKDVLLNGTRVFNKNVLFQMQDYTYGELVEKTKWHAYSKL